MAFRDKYNPFKPENRVYVRKAIRNGTIFIVITGSILLAKVVAPEFKRNRMNMTEQEVVALLEGRDVSRIQHDQYRD